MRPSFFAALAQNPSKKYWKVRKINQISPNNYSKNILCKKEQSYFLYKRPTLNGGPFGVPGAIRTRGLPLRRGTLYPAELRKHRFVVLFFMKNVDFSEKF